MESVADSLLLSSPVSDETLDRARRNALRIVAGALAAPGELVPPAPPEARRE
jgi:hypothetical protein